MKDDNELISRMNGNLTCDPVESGRAAAKKKRIPVACSKKTAVTSVPAVDPKEMWTDPKGYHEKLEKAIDDLAQKVKDSKIEERVQELEKDKWETPQVVNQDKDADGGEQYEQVNHPAHYNKYSVEVIEMFRRIYGDELTSKWCEMTALKYRMRMGTKPDNSIEQDLEKEQWYLKKAEQLKPKVLK